MDELNKAQERIEKDMVVRGKERFETARRRAEDSNDALRSKAYRVVLDTALEPLSKGIDKFLAEATQRRVGRRIRSALFMVSLEPDALAYVTLATILERAPKGQLKAVALAERIGRAVEVETHFTEKAVTDPDATFHEVQRIKKGATQRHRQTVAKHFTGAHERAGESDAWAVSDRVSVGMKLIELAITTTGLFRLFKATERGRTIETLTVVEGFGTWVDAISEEISGLFPTYAPCVVPPKDWTDMETGGYLTDALPVPLRFVKTNNKDHLELLRDADMSVHMRAANILQRTPWQINSGVLDVALELVSSGRPVAGLPDMDPMPLPSRPPNFEADPDASRQWKRAAADIHAANAKAGGNRLSALNAVAMARDYRDYERIYFPWQCDFRGRFYPLPTRITPQGNDLQKALLRFADGHPLGSSEGAREFEIQGANHYGVDKVSASSRSLWVSQNAEHIIASARAPLDYTWWMDADAPFCFLAWCLEYAGWAEDGFDLSFESRIPRSMDGSCNGIQHYSAMLLDPVGGRATNLIPGPIPQDLYREVAEWVIAELGTLDEPLARDWLGHGITRDVCKGPVIGFVYGGTVTGATKAILKYMDDLPPASRPFPSEETGRAASFLSSVIWQGIEEVAQGAAVAMQWLRDVARAAAREGHGLTWTTPSGFVVHHRSVKRKEKRIELIMFGKRIRSTLRQDTTAVDSRKQAQGFPPHYVHGMDAACLALTVVAAADRGIKHFAMIHDSFGCPAGQAPLLSQILREVFVNVYQKDPLRDLKETLEEDIFVELDEPPRIGGLDLTDTLRSTYFFI